MEEPFKECQELKNALDILGDRWSAVILWSIQDGPKRFIDIQRDTQGINSRTLTQRLQALELSGLLTRHEYKEYPPRTEYSITKKGTELQPIFTAMMQWAEKYAHKPAAKVATP
jgi:DNA-binding HxlR family transcriptional regulator